MLGSSVTKVYVMQASSIERASRCRPRRWQRDNAQERSPFPRFGVNYDGYFNFGAGDNNNSGPNNDGIIRGDSGDDTLRGRGGTNAPLSGRLQLS
jgi:hypothetical protein